VNSVINISVDTQANATPSREFEEWMRADAERRAPGAKHLHAALVAWLQRHDKAQREKGIPAEEALYAVVKSWPRSGMIHALLVRRDAVEACVPVSGAAACGQRLTGAWRLAGPQESVTCDRCLWHMSHVCVGHIEFD